MLEKALATPAPMYVCRPSIRSVGIF